MPREGARGAHDGAALGHQRRRQGDIALHLWHARHRQDGDRAPRAAAAGGRAGPAALPHARGQRHEALLAAAGLLPPLGGADRPARVGGARAAAARQALLCAEQEAAERCGGGGAAARRARLPRHPHPVRHLQPVRVGNLGARPPRADWHLQHDGPARAAAAASALAARHPARELSPVLALGDRRHHRRPTHRPRRLRAEGRRALRAQGCRRLWRHPARARGVPPRGAAGRAGGGARGRPAGRRRRSGGGRASGVAAAGVPRHNQLGAPPLLLPRRGARARAVRLAGGGQPDQRVAQRAPVHALAVEPRRRRASPHLPDRLARLPPGHRRVPVVRLHRRAVGARRAVVRGQAVADRRGRQRRLLAPLQVPHPRVPGRVRLPARPVRGRLLRGVDAQGGRARREPRGGDALLGRVCVGRRPVWLPRRVQVAHSRADGGDPRRNQPPLRGGGGGGGGTVAPAT
mmetsp:Transcript_5915/g.19585  ORF Transcript_5915/g.19585 Transcript_5915/m.19585 type:complete len:461 (-) Transcript_5915:64-1446(-)